MTRKEVETAIEKLQSELAENRKAITRAANDLLIELRGVLATHHHANGCCANAQALVDRLPLPEGAR